MKQTKRATVPAIIFNALVVITALFAVIAYFIPDSPLVPGSGALVGHQWECLRFFTTDSNLLAAVAAGVMLVYEIKALRGGQTPRWAVLLKYAATVSVALTFLTVALILGPLFSLPVFFMQGPAAALNAYTFLFSGNIFFLHFLTPVLALIAFLFFEREHRLSVKDALIAICPMLLYGALYTVFILTGVWPDMYNFTFGGQYWLAAIVLPLMIGFTFLISVLIRLIRNRVMKEKA